MWRLAKNNKRKKQKIGEEFIFAYLFLCNLFHVTYSLILLIMSAYYGISYFTA